HFKKKTPTPTLPRSTGRGGRGFRKTQPIRLPDYRKRGSGRFGGRGYLTVTGPPVAVLSARLRSVKPVTVVSVAVTVYWPAARVTNGGPMAIEPVEATMLLPSLSSGTVLVASTTASSR